MVAKRILGITFVILLLLAIVQTAVSQENSPQWTPLPVANDPLVRMPGTQPGHVTLRPSSDCTGCHSFDQAIEPVFNWQGSMMAQASRDFLFWATLVVAAQDSIHVLGNPNATDLCLRCHFPKGWLEERSDPTNASLMTGADYDGVQCTLCHYMWDPHFETTYSGVREGNDWLNYWDETNLSGTPSDTAAAATRNKDITQSNSVHLFNGDPFFLANAPFSPAYTEAGSGQYFVSNVDERRASFADANANHNITYSRFHKSKFFCASCHDVSNPVLANLEHSGDTPLPSETLAVLSYFHVERTFSEFMLSAYGQQGGAAGLGPYAPDQFDTSTANNYISRCQDCHMPDGVGKGAQQGGAVFRPDESVEHPNSGQPVHDMTGGNTWIPRILASTVTNSPNYDPVNATLLRQGPAVLTLDLNAGLGLAPAALLAAATRAEQQLERAAEIQMTAYDLDANTLTFRVQNQTGHKLISGFPEGRRMFLNIRAYDQSDALVYEINPYDTAAATLKGLVYPYQPDPILPAPLSLAAHELYLDELVYEMKPSSTITGEDTSFHFVLGTGRYKDNRIPPLGFDIANAAERLSEPVWEGEIRPDYFTTAEYAGGYDELSVYIPPGAARVEIRLYYQTTSREYIEFLRDEINGNPDNLTLPEAAYVAQTDPFFAGLKAWGDTIWQLWRHNRDLPGAAPYLMTQAELITCVYSAQSSAWGNAATWGGATPLATANVCIQSGHTVTLDSDTAVNQLWVAPGGALDLGAYTLTAESVLRNDGLLHQTRSVNQASVEFFHVQNSADDADLYRGVMINSGNNNLGNVTVTLWELDEGEFCTSTGAESPHYARRCYEIVPTTQPDTDVTVRLYARTDELNGIAEDELVVYRNTGGGDWVALANQSRGAIGNYHYAQGETSVFSAFLLGKDTPTVVRAIRFGETAQDYSLVIGLLLTLLGLTAVTTHQLIHHKRRLRL